MEVTGVREIEGTGERKERADARDTGKDAVMLPISHMGLGKGAFQMVHRSTRTPSIAATLMQSV